MRRPIYASVLALCLTAEIAAQTPYPDLLYYSFDEGSGAFTANLALPGAGTAQAAVNGLALDPGNGQFAGGLTGTGGTAVTHFVDTGWVTQLPGDFTLGFWLDLTAVTATNPFMYALGDVTANSFRCFTNGVAGTGNIALKQVGGMSDVVLPGGADPTAPHALAWVYDSSLSEIRGYVDGVLVAQVPQPPFTIAGSATFKVGGYDTFTSLLPGVVMDEFRLYGRALTPSEIAATWNVPLTCGDVVTYCTAKTGLACGTPAIASTGSPSAAATSGFVVTATPARSNKNGVGIYGYNGRTNLPFQGGTLCFLSPVRRTPAVSSGGSLGCDGVLSIDFSAFAAGALGGNPAPELSIAGTRVHAQFWARDSVSTGSLVSDAIEWTVCP